MTKQLAQRAKEIIEKVQYITLATAAKDGQPWNTPVYAVCDEQHNFLWISWREATHSKNVRENNKVFMVIYDSTRRRGDNHQQGVYILAKAYELRDKANVDHALKYLKGADGNKLDPSEFLDDSVKRIYRAVPKRVWLNDVSENQVSKETIKMRIEVPLSEFTA